MSTENKTNISERPATHTNNGNEQQPVDPKTQQFSSNGNSSSSKNIVKKDGEDLSDGLDSIFEDGFLSGVFDDPDFLFEEAESFYNDDSYKKELNFDDDILSIGFEEINEKVKQYENYLKNMSENSILSSDKRGISHMFSDKVVALAHLKRLIYLQKNFPLLKYNGTKRNIFLRGISSSGASGEESMNDDFSVEYIGLSKSGILGQNFLEIEKRVQQGIDSGWNGGSDTNEDKVCYVVTHEYGHALFDNYINNKLGKREMSEATVTRVYRGIVDEISDIASRNLSSYEKYDPYVDATGYVKSYSRFSWRWYAEWIAETFAVLVGNKKKTRGASAMEIWIKENL